MPISAWHIYIIQNLIYYQDLFELNLRKYFSNPVRMNVHQVSTRVLRYAYLHSYAYLPAGG